MESQLWSISKWTETPVVHRHLDNIEWIPPGQQDQYRSLDKSTEPHNMRGRDRISPRLKHSFFYFEETASVTLKPSIDPALSVSA